MSYAGIVIKSFFKTILFTYCKFSPEIITITVFEHSPVFGEREITPGCGGKAIQDGEFDTGDSLPDVS